MQKINESKGIRSGDPDPFRQLVEDHQSKVINTCYSFLKNKEDAEDAAQEVFIEVYDSLETFREEAQLSTWIYRIAVTKSLDIIRRKNRQKRFGRLKQVLGINEPLDQIPDLRLLNPEQQITADERLRILHQAIDSLAESQKIAITLSKLEGLSTNEIAKIMEISASAVESLVHRAKKNLHTQLTSYFGKNY